MEEVAGAILVYFDPLADEGKFQTYNDGIVCVYTGEGNISYCLSSI